MGLTGGQVPGVPGIGGRRSRKREDRRGPSPGMSSEGRAGGTLRALSGSRDALLDPGNIFAGRHSISCISARAVWSRLSAGGPVSGGLKRGLCPVGSTRLFSDLLVQARLQCLGPNGASWIPPWRAQRSGGPDLPLWPGVHSAVGSRALHVGKANFLIALEGGKRLPVDSPSICSQWF